MKKNYIIILMLLILFISGCGKKETTCTLDKNSNEDMKSYTEIKLYYNDDIVTKEEIKIQYIFKSNELLENNYKKIEEVLQQDDSLKIEQSDKKIIVRGEKDVSDMKYDKKSKIEYYEQLGYTCK